MGIAVKAGHHDIFTGTLEPAHRAVGYLPGHPHGVPVAKVQRPLYCCGDGTTGGEYRDGLPPTVLFHYFIKSTVDSGDKIQVAGYVEMVAVTGYPLQHGCLEYTLKRFAV